MGAGPPSVPQTPLLTQGALPAARGQHPAGTTSAAGALEADVGPHAAPVGHQSLRPPCPEPLAWSKGPRNAGTGGQSERSGCAHVPGSRARHGSEKGRIKWDREGATFPAIPDIPARGDGRSVPRLDRDTGSKTGMWGKGQGCGGKDRDAGRYHAPLDLGRGRESRGASLSGWDPSGQALLQLEAGIAGAPLAAHPRCSWKREKEKGEIQLPLHGKAGRLLPRGIHPALAAGEEQGHTGSLEEQLHQHDRRLQHVPAPAFPPAFPLALGPAPPPPAEPGTMRDWRGARAGGSPAAPTHPPKPTPGLLGSPQGCPVPLGRVVTSRPLLPWLRAGKGGPP